MVTTYICLALLFLKIKNDSLVLEVAFLVYILNRILNQNHDMQLAILFVAGVQKETIDSFAKLRSWL